ncbi:MAG: glycosyltransferase, partial [Oscillospiraceae bacterium]|nr:glycosyltransferase [Oscillospiraceae bacterium]
MVEGLVEKGFEHIVIVNDGSKKENLHFFEEAAEHESCFVLHHEVNKGKGRALKNAFAYVAENLPQVDGVITIDGDGQHLLEDIVACGERMLQAGEGVVLGCRDFSQPGIPPRSVAGNRTTSRFFRLLFNIKLADTQTGLRAIPAKYLESFCAIEGERFEYETNMLLNMKRMGIPFIEQPIATVYDPDDYSSHYNAVKDSMRIFKVMLKFLATGSGFRYIISGICSWIVDNLLYFLFMSSGLGSGIAAAAASVRSQIFARVLSSVFNFNMNTFYVFRSRENYLKALLKYYC